MVLENAAALEAPFSENAPTSDIDPYASTDTINPATRSVIRVTPAGAPAVYVNLDILPRRWSLLGTKAHHPMLPKGITESCRYVQEILGRPVKQDEADALAYHFAKSTRIGSYGTPVGVSLASLQAYRTQEKFRFPGGFSPLNHKRFDADTFGPLRGQSARAAWQMLRVTMYWGIGGILGGILFAMYGISSAAAARSLDPRLKEFTEALKDRAGNRQGLPGGRQVDQKDGPRKDETMEMARQRRTAQGAWGRRREQQGGERGEDDMSPTGGAFQEDFVHNGSDTGLMDDQQMRKQEYEQRAESRASPVENNASTHDHTRVRTRARSTDQEKEQTPSATSATPKSGDSAWDRIRQDAMSGRPTSTGNSSRTPAQRQSRRSADPGDSFTFSQREEDKQLAKSEAQREVDTRIERERAGKDFEDQSNRSRRW